MSKIKKAKKETYRYTVSFTVETARKMNVHDVEEKAADVWDSSPGIPFNPFVDSYAFCAVED